MKLLIYALMLMLVACGGSGGGGGTNDPLPEPEPDSEPEPEPEPAMFITPVLFPSEQRSEFVLDLINSNLPIEIDEENGFMQVVFFNQISVSQIVMSASDGENRQQRLALWHNSKTNRGNYTTVICQLLRFNELPQTVAHDEEVSGELALCAEPIYEISMNYVIRANGDLMEMVVDSEVVAFNEPSNDIPTFAFTILFNQSGDVVDMIYAEHVGNDYYPYFMRGEKNGVVQR